MQIKCFRAVDSVSDQPDEVIEATGFTHRSYDSHRHEVIAQNCTRGAMLYSELLIEVHSDARQGTSPLRFARIIIEDDGEVIYDKDVAGSAGVVPEVVAPEVVMLDGDRGNPTLLDYVRAGYPVAGYPPSGYPKIAYTDEELEEALKIEASIKEKRDAQSGQATAGVSGSVGGAAAAATGDTGNASSASLQVNNNDPKPFTNDVAASMLEGGDEEAEVEADETEEEAEAKTEGK